MYKYADQERIYIFFDHLKISEALTIKDGQTFNIALDLDRIQGEYSEKVVLMHELAHIATDAFYGLSDDLRYRGKMEKRAQKWMIKTMVPYNDLLTAMKKGLSEPWELADYFSIPESLVLDAMQYYKQQCLNGALTE